MRGFRDIYSKHPVLSVLFVVFVVWQLISSAHLIPAATRDDTWVHFIFSVIVSQMIFLLIVEFGQIKDEHGHRSRFTHFGTLLLVLLAGMAVGCIWEMTEFALDRTLHAQLQHGNFDTMTDLIADTVGSLVGGMIMIRTDRNR